MVGTKRVYSAKKVNYLTFFEDIHETGPLPKKKRTEKGIFKRFPRAFRVKRSVRAFRASGGFRTAVRSRPDGGLLGTPNFHDFQDIQDLTKTV